jgi:hypothetical protein
MCRVDGIIYERITESTPSVENIRAAKHQTRGPPQGLQLESACRKEDQPERQFDSPNTMRFSSDNLPPGIISAMHRAPASTISPTRKESESIAQSKGESVECEHDLHDDIEAYCKGRGWYYVHSRMDKPTTTALGVPDFIIALPEGKTLWVECKRKGGKLRAEQQGVAMMLDKLQHHWAVVFSFEEFITIVRAAEANQR